MEFENTEIFHKLNIWVRRGNEGSLNIKKVLG